MSTPQRGGRRVGAGRPRTNHTKRQVSLPPEVWQFVGELRGARSVSRTVEDLIRAHPAFALHQTRDDGTAQDDDVPL